MRCESGVRESWLADTVKRNLPFSERLCVSRGKHTEPSPVSDFWAFMLMGRTDTTQWRKCRQNKIPQDPAGQPIHKNDFMSGGVGCGKGQKFRLCKMVLVASGTHRAKESNHCSFQKTTKNDLHPSGKRSVLRSELRGKSNGIKSEKLNF